MRALLCMLVVVVASPRPADACSCGRIEPCEAFWQADVVFTGTVTTITARPKFRKDGKVIVVGEASQSVTLAVDQKLRGTLGDTVTVEAGGLCGTELEAGADYFIYARRDGAQLVLGSCSRSDKLADAADDLAYARTLPNRKLGVVQGRVTRNTEDGHDVAVANIGVSARGAPAVARTDARGNYRLDVAAGKHALDIVGPSLRLRGSVDVTIPNPAACATVDLEVTWKGRARGRLVDHTRQPAAGIRVVARDTGKTWTRQATTKVDGTYELDSIPPGATFAVTVSSPEDGGPTPLQPIPSTSYGKLVKLPASDLADKLDFALPAPLPVHASTIVVRDHAGVVASTEITLTSSTGSERFTTDARGRLMYHHLGGALALEGCVARNNRRACGKITRTLDRADTIELVLR